MAGTIYEKVPVNPRDEREISGGRKNGLRI